MKLTKLPCTQIHFCKTVIGGILVKISNSTPKESLGQGFINYESQEKLGYFWKPSFTCPLLHFSIKMSLTSAVRIKIALSFPLERALLQLIFNMIQTRWRYRDPIKRPYARVKLKICPMELIRTSHPGSSVLLFQTSSGSKPSVIK